MPDYNSLLKGFGSTTEPLDTQGNYKELLEGFTPVTPDVPQVSPETVEAATKQPVGRPEGEQEAQPTEEPLTDTGAIAPAYAEAQQVAAQEADKLQLNPYISGGSYGTAIENIQEQGRLAGEGMSLEGKEATKEFIREEGLPAVTGTAGALLAPMTGGTSFWLSSMMTAGFAGAGAGIGEAIEQKAKQEGILTLAKSETMPKDGWDIMTRASWRAGEEAAFSMVPDILFRGMGVAKRKLLTMGGKPVETIDGTVIDEGKKAMVDAMRNYAAKEGLDESKVLLASDVAEVPLFKMAEDVARNSYIGGKKVEAVRDVQAEAIRETITEKVGQYMKPAKGYVDEASDSALARYIEPNMENLNSFAVAGLIHAGFNKAQEAQKQVARSIYGTIDGLMEQTTMKTIYKEVELPLLGPNGKPLTTMQNVTEEHVAFPVNLSGVREFAEGKLDDSLFGTDPVLMELIGMPGETSYKKAADALVELKGRSRTLARSSDEAAPRRKMLVDQAIKQMEPAVDDALKLAEDAGIVGPDGKTLSELKGEADSIWKEQVEDFQNSYIANIMKKADFVNGAPDKLGSMFMQNEMAAVKILKVIDDAKGELKGDALEQILATENAVRGSIVESIFMPFDNIKGQYVAPDVAQLTAKGDTLKRLFGEEEYKELVKLGGMIETQSRQGASNYLGFAQRARESGMIMTTLKSLTRADFGPLLRDGSATVFFAMGAGRILTKKQNIKYAQMLADPKVPEALKIQAAQALVHRTYEYQQAQQAAVSDDRKELMEGEVEDRKEAERIRQGM